MFYSCSVVQEIQRINELELASGSTASWHDQVSIVHVHLPTTSPLPPGTNEDSLLQYKDSAYIYVGGLAPVLTEGDVITIFSQYGEVVDISLPRDQATQKTKGFAFLMYADQRSTVLAVDNLGGAKVLDRTLRVDHVKDYKQLERDQDTGKMKERDEQRFVYIVPIYSYAVWKLIPEVAFSRYRLAAHPDNFRKALPGAGSDHSDSDSDSSHPSIDLDDPMRDYLISQKRAAKKNGGSKSAKKESKEERRKRKEERRQKRELKKFRASGSGKGKYKSSTKKRDRDDEQDGGRSTRDPPRRQVEDRSRSRDRYGDEGRGREGGGSHDRNYRDRDEDGRRDGKGRER